MKKTELFACPLLYHDVPFYSDIKEKFVNEIYTLRDNSVGGVVISNRGGWQSPPIPPMQKTLRVIMNDICTNIRQTLLESGNEIYIQSLWYNINGPGASNDRHTHPGCDLAGIFFVKVPEGDCGELEIENPNHFAQYHMLSSLDEKLKKDLRASHSMWLPPEEGATVIFPSNILHRVMTNNTDEDRISIAWNMRIVDRP